MKYSINLLRDILISYQVKNINKKSKENVITVSEILKIFNFKSEENLFSLVLDLLEKEMQNIDFNSLEQTLKIFSNSNIILDVFLKQHDKKKTVLELMEKINDKINQLNKNIESEILKNASNDITKIIQQIINKCMTPENEYDLLKSAIFEVKRPRILKSLMDTFPDLANSKDKNNNLLFSEVLDKCLSLLYSDDIKGNYNEFLYFQYIINMFLDSQVLEIDKKYINKVISAISYVRKNCDFNKEYIEYLLEKILQKLKKEYVYVKKNFESKCYCNKIRTEINSSTQKQGIDLTNLYTFTIDESEAVLLDDAISFEIIDSKYYNLYIHITDVWNTVPCKSPLPMNEYNKCGSEEESHLSIASLPYNFFYKNCSLFKGNDRSCFTIKFLIDKDGVIHNHDIFKSHIVSNMRLRIKDFNYITNSSVNDNYELFKTLYELSSAIRVKRLSKRFASVKTESSDKGNMTVQELMILVNHYIAKHFKERNLPFSYCTQDCKNMKDTMLLLESKIKNEKNLTLIKDYIKSDLEGMIYSSIITSHNDLCLDAYSSFTKPMLDYLSYVNQGPVNDLLIGYPTDERIDYYKNLYEEIVPKLNEMQMLETLYKLQKRKEESIAETILNNEKVKRKQ